MVPTYQLRDEGLDRWPASSYRRPTPYSVQKRPGPSRFGAPSHPGEGLMVYSGGMRHPFVGMVPTYQQRGEGLDRWPASSLGGPTPQTVQKRPGPSRFGAPRHPGEGCELDTVDSTGTVHATFANPYPGRRNFHQKSPRPVQIALRAGASYARRALLRALGWGPRPSKKKSPPNKTKPITRAQHLWHFLSTEMPGSERSASKIKQWSKFASHAQ